MLVQLLCVWPVDRFDLTNIAAVLAAFSFTVLAFVPRGETGAGAQLAFRGRDVGHAVHPRAVHFEQPVIEPAVAAFVRDQRGAPDHLLQCFGGDTLGSADTRHLVRLF
jgi:hypothetical protein